MLFIDQPLALPGSAKHIKKTIFTESSHWPDSVLESQCPTVCCVLSCHQMQFFLGLLFALRSHDWFPGPSLVNPPSKPIFFTKPLFFLFFTPPPPPQKTPFLSVLVSVLLFASVERFSASRMWNLFLFILQKSPLHSLTLSISSSRTILSLT